MQFVRSDYPDATGVYRMHNAAGECIYVGKARSLRKRIAQYFQNDLPIKTQLCMQEVCEIGYTVTPTEWDALLLEARLIKAYAPRYNILLKDDKSYPYLYVNTAEKFPRFRLYRGDRSPKGWYFGPYPNARAVRKALDTLNKLFRLRHCNDAQFRHRSRPCLQYQMQRCTAPCVQYVDASAYQQQIGAAMDFLRGKNKHVLRHYEQLMWQAAQAEAFEQATQYRDIISQLQQLHSEQIVVKGHRDIDVFAYAADASLEGNSPGGGGVLSRILIRGGWVLGHRNYPIHESDPVSPQAIHEWIAQCFASEQEEWPACVLLAPDAEPVESPVVQMRPVRGAVERRLYTMAWDNARHALAQLRLKHAKYQQAVRELQADLGLLHAPRTLMCTDASHLQGEATVVSLVWMAASGLQRAQCKRYRVHPDAPGDDYAALSEALHRYAQSVQLGKAGWPDVLCVDGGLGQYRAAQRVLREHGVALPLLAIAKGPLRKSGAETVWYDEAGGDHPRALSVSPQSFLWLQEARDWSHRWAVTGHRTLRDKKRLASNWHQNIPGIGPRRKKQLEETLGSLQAVSEASVERLQAIGGISAPLAEAVYRYFREQAERLSPPSD